MHIQVSPTENQTPTQWNPIGHITTASPPVNAQQYSAPPHLTPAKKNSVPVSKMLLFLFLNLFY
jgi:hypothetical protein